MDKKESESDVKKTWAEEYKKKQEQDRKKDWTDWQKEFDRQQFDAFIRERLRVSKENEKISMFLGANHAIFQISLC